jgi:dihydroorotase
LQEAIRALTIGPVRALGLDRRIEGIGTLSPGAPGDVVLIDANAEWTVEPETFASKGKNTPLGGRRLCGGVVATACEGRVVWKR